MSVEVIAQDSSELTLQIKVNLNDSMLNIEDKIQTACNEAGLVSTEVAYSALILMGHL